MKQTNPGGAGSPAAPVPAKSPPVSAATGRRDGTAAIIAALLGQAVALHELLDVAALRENDEVRVLVEGLIEGLRGLTGAG